MSFQTLYPLMAYSDNELVEQVGPHNLILKSGVIPDFNAGTPVNAVAATGVLTSADTPHDTDTITIGDVEYTFKTALTEVYATGVLTSDTTNPTDGDTVTVGTVTYRFKATMAAANDVQLDAGADADVSLHNLMHAINGTGTVGVEYYAGTQQPNATSSTVSAHALTITANTLGIEGNTIAKAEVSTHLDWDGTGAYLTGGFDAIPYQILIDGRDNSLTNLEAAINGTTGEGTTYSTGTVEHPDVSCGDVGSHAVTITAKVKGVAGNSIATVPDPVRHQTFNHAHLGGAGATAGVNGTVGGQFAVYVDGSNLWVAVLDNTIADANWKKAAWV